MTFNDLFHFCISCPLPVRPSLSEINLEKNENEKNVLNYFFF